MPYPPPLFDERRPHVLYALMRAHPLALVVTAGGNGFAACHIPLLLHEPLGAPVVLHGHVAKANPLQCAAAGASALAVFQGPNHYISPSWYPSKRKDSKAVPTWNYFAVQAHCSLRLIEDAGWLRQHLQALTQLHESGRREPWQIEHAPAEYIDALVRNIVGVELTVREISGTAKLSQNRTPEDREGVIAGLLAEGEGDARALVQWMRH